MNQEYCALIRILASVVGVKKKTEVKFLGTAYMRGRGGSRAVQ